MIYLRGDPHDYDNWEKLGATGWSWKDVFPYFLRSEGNTDPRYFNDRYHNSSGPLIVSSNSYYSPFNSSKYLVDASKELGFKEIDLNGATRIGTGYVQQTIDPFDETRESASKAFLEPVINNRTNLHILANSFVTKILFSSNKTAIGVEYQRNNRTFRAFVKKEVILSAGVIQSPHILLLSGIGPKQQLKKFNIPLVAELKGVGQNLRDHVFNAEYPTVLIPKAG
jgi:choline dehydrogenase-like flavoprotein